MKRFIISTLILLLGVIMTACGTPTPMGPVEQQMTAMAAQVQACATLQSLGTPYPCNPPTSTPTPIPPTPTPTATPFTGWMYYPESGGATPMPPGFEPAACDNKVIGCPGQSYRYFIDGVPQGPDANTYKGTPAYWPYVLVGVPVLIVVLGLLFFSAYGMAAPQRAIAKATLMMAAAYAKTMEQMQNAPALGSGTGAPDANNMGIPIEFLGKCLLAFAQEHDVPRDFKHSMIAQLRSYRRGDLVPLVTIQQLLLGYDKEHETKLARPFGEYISVHAHELVGGSQNG